ncbi:zinc-finger domain-containing protein [Paenibacillus sp. RUD330]|uniref:zinc-finger domain-containing protein n=1 Tax=Paenibacillus sp. RUD330 TaxID=2023772 RepID=UPI001F0EAE7C|nr:zinc-finger domain-containing protein [Paenibacillus sp. RUD330]
MDCPIKKNFIRASRGHLARIDRYCKSECSHGIKLQQLGGMLTCRKRKSVQWEFEEGEDANDLA